MRLFTLLLLIQSIVSICSGQTGERYKDASQYEINRYLWKNSNEIWSGSLELRIRELVERGADVDFINPHENPKTPPFLNASGMLENLKEQDHFTQSQIDSMEIEAVKIVKYLAKKGANIHAVSSYDNMNALHLAACGGREKIIPVLVKMGLDINEADSIGGTPLIHAIGAGDLATVKAIVKCGADINICTPDGNSPLDWAMAYARAKKHLWGVHYHDQDAIAQYLQSLPAKHGKNKFTGYLNLKE